MYKSFFNRLVLSCALITLWLSAMCQNTGDIAGFIKDANSQEPLIGVSVILEGTTIGGITDIDGYYKITGILPAPYSVKATYIGYDPAIRYDIVVTSGNTNFVNFELEESSTDLEEIVVRANPFRKRQETPISIQSLSTQEIKSYPGGNNDIAKVVQSLPGVSGSVGFRNDIIIRGGAPNENVYYLDGIEIPNINHFATQGSAGGPVGMLNVSFIDDVTLSTSAFNARYDNPLSGILQFGQRTGNPEKTEGNIRLGASEFAGTLEGPLLKNNKDLTYIVSVRRSYLQLLFELIDLPFLPSYWDYQYKVNWKVNKNNEISLIGIGSIDDFTLNPPEDATLEQQSILDAIPVNSQWSSTIGITWKHLMDNGYMNVALSGNYLNNEADKFDDNDDGNEAKRRLKYRSTEDENKLRVSIFKYRDRWKFSYGFNAQNSEYSNSTFNRLSLNPPITIDYKTELQFFRFGAFGQVSKRSANSRFIWSLGLRTDANTFTDNGMEAWKTFSPRFSLSYALNSQWNLNASAGRYFKIAPYTVLGFRNNFGELVNRDVEYISSDHFVAGVEWLPKQSTRITLEGFYKYYRNYPVSVKDSISLANLGGDFGILGNEEIASLGLGRTYGFELLYQQKLTKNFYSIIAYTFYVSEFTGFDQDKFVASSWDNRHLVSFTGGYKFKRNWELGVRFRYLGEAPYTPFDTTASLNNYAVTGSGVLDYNQINSLRLNAFNAMDVRIDKKWSFKQWSLDVYLDIQNLYSSNNPSSPDFTLKRNPNNTIATRDGTPYDPLSTDPLNTIPVILNSDNGSALPTIGFVIEF